MRQDSDASGGSYSGVCSATNDNPNWPDDAIDGTRCSNKQATDGKGEDGRRGGWIDPLTLNQIFFLSAYRSLGQRAARVATVV